MTQTGQTSTATVLSSPLPMKPEVTPAIGIAGVILIGTGVALCLIGVKHKWLQTFLSTALLTSLAVLVLIVYVMTPPVKQAIQGAYLVAIVATGLIFGSVSIVFKDITEGLGCLLGGFCLAMWFLCLSPGGLIKTIAGRAIMIAVMCGVGFSFSFSRYTRQYGLIVLTSFAGAQVTIIGVDCFSLAGLKEFWLYIWDLNPNEFPLNTNTYPITRGIKVELACTVILFLFGVMSQFKIWKIVKERRARRDAERLANNETRDQLEAAVGEEIERRNEHDRRQWEAMYGDKDQTRVNVDSGVGSSVDSLTKRSTSVKERELDSIELLELPEMASNRLSKRSLAAAQVASDKDLQQMRQAPDSEDDFLDKSDLSRSTSHRSLIERRTSGDPGKGSVRESTQEGPEIIPLPFKIPGETDEEEEAPASDHGSAVTAGLSVLERRGIPLTRLTLKKKLEADNAVAVPDIEADRASSVAATADEDVDMDKGGIYRLSQTPSLNQLKLPSPTENERDRSRSPRRSLIEIPVEEDDEEVILRPNPVTDEPEKPEEKFSRRISGASSHRRSAASSRSVGESKLGKEADGISAVGSLKGYLPNKLSKVAMTYRTNEWAKHIADADQPEDDQDLESNSPGIKVDHVFAQEAAKPVNVEELMPCDDLEPPMARNISRISSSNPYKQSMQTTPAMSRSNSTAATPIYAFPRSNSQISLNRNGGNSTSLGKSKSHQALRNSSAPLINSPLVESPVEETPALSHPYRNPSAPAMSAANLMDERNDRLKRKHTSTSFNAVYPQAHVNVASTNLSESVATRLDEADNGNPFSERKRVPDEDDMTLAERKALMKQQPPPPPPSTSPQDHLGVIQSHTTLPFDHQPLPVPSSGKRTSTQPTRMPSTLSINNQNLIYDSHQPKRTATVDTAQQTARLNQWRQSLQQDAVAAAAKVPAVLETTSSIAARHQQQEQQRRREAERAKRENAINVAMRSGQWHGAHREAIRRLQAKANNEGV